MTFELILGNSAEKLCDLKAESIDLTVTSPPYDNLREYNGGISTWSFDTFSKIADELYRVTKHGGVVVWVVGDETSDFSESLTSFKQAVYFVERAKFNLLDTMIFQKASFLAPGPTMRRYNGAFEYMFVFSKGRPNTFNPINDVPAKEPGIHAARVGRRQPDGTMTVVKKVIDTPEYLMRGNIWPYLVGWNHGTADLVAKDHPARFPEKLALDHIKSWTNEGDTVLDPFLGSGTTGKMSVLNNRNFIGIELDPTYYEMSRERITRFASNLNDLISA